MSEMIRLMKIIYWKLNISIEQILNHEIGKPFLTELDSTWEKLTVKLHSV